MTSDDTVIAIAVVAIVAAWGSGCQEHGDMPHGDILLNDWRNVRIAFDTCKSASIASQSECFETTAPRQVR